MFVTPNGCAERRRRPRALDGVYGTPAAPNDSFGHLARRTRRLQRLRRLQRAHVLERAQLHTVLPVLYGKTVSLSEI